MKIAIICPHFQAVPPPREGGTERVVAYLCEEWLALGHEVSLFAASDSTVAVTELVSAGESILSRQEEPPSLASAFEAISISQLLSRIDEFDIVHCHTEFSHLAALQNHRHKVITTLHWRVDEEDRQATFRFFQMANLIAISQDQASYLSGGRAIVIPHGIPEGLYSASTSANSGLAFIGRMTDQKRPDRALEIARRSGCHLTLAGGVDVGNPTYFDRLVRPHLSEMAQWVGSIDDSQKETLLQNAAALLFPIDWDEPFGLVMIEAMACGCPVIAWDRGSVREVIEHGVSGFIVSSVEEAVAAVHQISSLDRRAVRAAFERSFTSERMARHHLDYFAERIAPLA